MKNLSVVFAGTPEFAVSALDALAASPHSIRAVYTQPDRPAGRGQAVQVSAVKARAIELEIPVEQPISFKEDQAIVKFKSYAPDVLVVVAYGLILPTAVLSVPTFGCLNIHASLLPRWRGAAPIQRAIMAGDEQTGVAIMKMEAGLDTGPVYLQREVVIGREETAGALHDRLARLGAEALIDVLAVIANNPTPVAQPEAGVTYARKIVKSEAQIDWRKSALQLDREVRAFNPWPVSETLWDGKQLRIWAAQPQPASGLSAEPGSVVGADASGIDVATGDGVLHITRLQLAGRKPVSAAEFLNAHRIVGARLGSHS